LTTSKHQTKGAYLVGAGLIGQLKGREKDDKKVDTSGKSLAHGHHRSNQMPAPGNRSRVFLCRQQGCSGPANQPAPNL
jgi:hypothetical protein